MTSLLEEIKNEAIDANSDLSQILRKCKALAAEMQSQPLENWLLWESNGYPQGIDVPDYRSWGVAFFGNFMSPTGDIISNSPIHYPKNIPAETWDKISTFECRDGVASVAGMNAQKSDAVTLSMNPHIVGRGIYENCPCVEMRGMFNKSRYANVLHTVRERILDFALQLSKTAPDAQNIEGLTQTIRPQQQEQIVHATILGGQNIIGNAPTVNITIGDIAALETKLKQIGVTQKDIADLKVAINSETAPRERGSFAPQIAAWFGEIAKKAAKGGENIALDAVKQSILSYLGLL